MPTLELAQWNERLSRHYADLHQLRQSKGGLPLFVLEHGLSQTEVQDLSGGIRAQIQGYWPNSIHALAWIVYAAELGYRYSGDEYWQTFEAETPGWRTWGSRNLIRAWFRRFYREYGGAVPTGAWAVHFSIICWPITHAILPRDLQQQLAKILFDLRYSFSKDLLESPSQLGEAIASRAWSGTARFQNFAQETVLVGQIAGALLRSNVGEDTLIHRATLLRIVQDLERERLGREWLKDARHFAEERARIRGLSAGRPKDPAQLRSEEARAEVDQLGIEPRVILRPRDTSGLEWEVSLEIPDLSHLLQRFPSAHDVLTGSRCVVAGAASRPLARGRLLHGSQRVLLSRWPRSDEMLLQFEQTDPQLQFLLRTDCLLRPGPTWLLKIAADGFAYEMRGRRVRAGGRYILIGNDPEFARSPYVRPINLRCSGVFGGLMELPADLTPAWEAELQRLGLIQAKLIEVWPAGLGAAIWDGDGYGEWLASEQPCLAIRCDHAIGWLNVSIDEDTSLEIVDARAGDPIFVELPVLAVGLYKVTFSKRAGPYAPLEAIGDLDVLMRIRDARPWAPGISPHGPIAVDVEPPTPTLEELWEGRVEIAVRGPVGRPVKCKLSLFNTVGGPPTLTQVLPPLSLPLYPDQWIRQFDNHIQRSKACQRSYDDAKRAEIEFSIDEFGGFTLKCEREFTPVRWAIRRVRDMPVARLYEDVGTEEPTTVKRIPFEQPVEMEHLDLKTDYSIPPTGGLYVAEHGEFSAGIVIGPSVHTFADFRLTPRIGGWDRSAASLQRLIECSSVWYTARLPGDIFSARHRRIVLRALTSHLSQIIADRGWADAESAASADRFEAIVNLSRAISRNPRAADAGHALLAEIPHFASMAKDARVERFATLTTRFFELATTESKWISELALRIASYPMTVKAWAGDRLTEGLAALLERPTVMRAARFLVISTDRHFNSSLSGDELYASWSWK
jgi:hypothetical protein